MSTALLLDEGFIISFASLRSRRERHRQALVSSELELFCFVAKREERYRSNESASHTRRVFIVRMAALLEK